MKNGDVFWFVCRRKCTRLFITIVLLMLIVFTTMHLKDITVSKSSDNEYPEKTGEFDQQIEQATASLRSFAKSNHSTTATGYGNTKQELRNTELDSAKTEQDEAVCLSWCQRKMTQNGVFLLSAVLLVRIYATDRAKLSTRELIQWLYYLSYAGFEHVFVYDSYVFKNESQKDALGFLIKHGFVTYVDWSHNAFPYSVSGTQESAYQHCLDNYGNKSLWQASIDIDEYPFCPPDVKPNFMQRFIANFSSENPDVAQITMQNFLFLGKPLDEIKNPLLIDRLRRRTHGVSNDLVKPIYRTADVMKAGIHHHDLRDGESQDADHRRIRLNHYWGARLQNWGEDTPEILAKTRPDDSIQEIVDGLLRCDTACLPNSSIIYKFRLN